MTKTNDLKIFQKEIHGLTTIYVKVPFTLNAMVSFFSMSGSYAENEKNQGVAHYLEHLFFKGTKNRDRFKLTEDAALLGADQNAYTSEYNTMYYLNVPATNMGYAIELLCDMMFNPLFPAAEVEKERTVIQEERKMYDDDPSSCFSNTTQRHFFNFQTGHDIVGTEETINNIKREDLINYHETMYGSNNTILLIVSSLDEDAVFKECEKYLRDNPIAKKEVEASRLVITPELFKNDIPNKDYVFEHKGIQQIFLMGLYNGKGYKDTERTKMICLLNAIGGGMYSLLFKKIRDELGLCYTVWAYDYLPNASKSVAAIYSQVAPEKYELAREKMIQVIENVKKNGLDKHMFDCAKAHQLGSFCRNLEYLNAVSNIIGKAYLFGEKDLNPIQKYNEIINLTHEDIEKFAEIWLPNANDIVWSIMKPGELK